MGIHIHNAIGLQASRAMEQRPFYRFSDDAHRDGQPIG
jgi:hypothetical protein